ncbi:MAG: hypothetical protein C0594_03510 [Marinilabiliales bacterium]|nr:MAG: hypothetical protein C0594_03510 [Marinilabiliales bacterium]
MKKFGRASVIISIASIVMVLLFALLSGLRVDGWALILNGVLVYGLLFASIFAMFTALVMGIVGLSIAKKRKEPIKLHLFSIISMCILMLVGIYFTYIID